MSHRVNFVLKDQIWEALQFVPKGERSAAVNDALAHWTELRRRRDTATKMDHLRESVSPVLGNATEIELINPRNPSLRPLRQNALVDSGAITLCIPEHVALQLQLTELEKREVSTADGKSLLVSYVGPVQIHFENRNCFTGALVMGDTVLLGAVPLEDMDLVINPRLQQVTVNPASPNIPTAVVKKAVTRNI